MADSEMTEILPESAKYVRKAQWGLYTKNDPVSVINRCWQPAGVYLESSYTKIEHSLGVPLEYCGI